MTVPGWPLGTPGTVVVHTARMNHPVVWDTMQRRPDEETP